MSEELIEKIARALERDYHGGFSLWDQLAYETWDEWKAKACIAIAVIEASGTHVVVPVEPTGPMVEMLKTYYDWPVKGFSAAIAARPKVTE
jgi:hypothetical protein